MGKHQGGELVGHREVWSEDEWIRYGRGEKS